MGSIGSGTVRQGSGPLNITEIQFGGRTSTYNPQTGEFGEFTKTTSYSTSTLSNMNTSRLENIAKNENIDNQTRKDIEDILKSRRRDEENARAAYRMR